MRSRPQQICRRDRPSPMLNPNPFDRCRSNFLDIEFSAFVGTNRTGHQCPSDLVWAHIGDAELTFKNRLVFVDHLDIISRERETYLLSSRNLLALSTIRHFLPPMGFDAQTLPEEAQQTKTTKPPKENSAACVLAIPKYSVVRVPSMWRCRFLPENNDEQRKYDGIGHEPHKGQFSKQR